MTDKPVMEVGTDGTKFWYLNGKLHNEHGPAVEYANGDKYWYLNDELQRKDGPAVERSDGCKEWHLNGELIVSTGPDIEKALFTLSTYLQDQEVTKDD